MGIYLYKNTIMQHPTDDHLHSFYLITKGINELSYLGSYSEKRKVKSLTLSKCRCDFDHIINMHIYNDLGLDFEDFMVSILGLTSLGRDWVASKIEFNSLLSSDTKF